MRTSRAPSAAPRIANRGTRRLPGALRQLLVRLTVGGVIAGLDLAMLALIGGLLRAPQTALLLNCLAGIGLSLFALHPQSRHAHQALKRRLSGRAWGRRLLAATSASPDPGPRTKESGKAGR